MNAPFKICALYTDNKKAEEHNLMLAVVHLSSPEEDNPIMVKLKIGDLVIDSGKITSDDTSTFLGPILLDTKYNIDVEAETVYAGEVLVSKGESEENPRVSVDMSVINANNQATTLGIITSPTAVGIETIATDANTAAATTIGLFEAKDPSGRVWLSTYSLFEAIEECRYRGSEMYVLRDSEEVVFRYDKYTTRYYKYRFTAYYGYTTNSTDATTWLNTYEQTHVLKGHDCQYYGHAYNWYKGNVHEEVNSGGYWYKDTNSYQFSKSAMRIYLTRCSIKVPTNTSQKKWNC